MPETDNSESEITQSRHDLQIPRRIFHAGTGLVAVLLYTLLLNRQQAVTILGAVISVLYIFDRARLAYPEYQEHFSAILKYLVRAEERMNEVSSIPYGIALLLTIITFPKVVALCAICIIAFGDPASAIVGIKYGKHELVPNRTAEGSLAFFVVCLAAIVINFSINTNIEPTKIWWLAVISATICAGLEMIPLRVDDNLTIPLFSATTIWVVAALMGIPFS